MTLTDLYSITDEKNINVYDFKLDGIISMTIPYCSNYYIAIDSTKLNTSIDKKICLAHEIGHCETNSFYNVYTPYDIREQHENRANRWAIKKLIPLDELKEAVRHGYKEFWQLAEYFDVPNDFMKSAIHYYKGV